MDRFLIIVVIIPVIDLFLQGKHGSRSMSFKQAACWSLVWVTLSLIFAAALWLWLNHTSGQSVATAQTTAFLTRYVLEKALAVDNVFVWLMLFSYFAIPAHLQQRVLVYGVLCAIVMRTAMIFAGSWLVSEFSWILYLFGVFLILTGLKMMFSQQQDSVPKKPLVLWLKKQLRLTDDLHGQQFFVTQKGVRYATPLLLVLIMVELSDVIFAVDSIPAIFAVTTDPFIVITSNLFAILGLRAMYFLLSGMAEKFSLLKYGLAVILVFIDFKMLLLDLWHIPTPVSLGIIGLILATTLLSNHFINFRKPS